MPKINMAIASVQGVTCKNRMQLLPSLSRP